MHDTTGRERRTLAHHLDILGRSANDIILLADAAGHLLDANDKALEVYGYTRDELLERPDKALCTDEAREHCATQWRLIEQQGGLVFETEHRRKDGGVFPVEVSARIIDVEGARLRLAIIRDISARRSVQEHMGFLAHHDALTRLPNRMLLHDRIEQALARARRDGLHVGVLFIDLDNFKSVNDSFGHDSGDRLLQAVAERLRRCVRDMDTVGRLGGDEFLITVPDLHDAADALPIAQKLLRALAGSFKLDGHELNVTPSIGVSVFPEDAHNATTLVRCADAAMYTAKDGGRNTLRFFTPVLRMGAGERRALEDNLRRALEHGEFELYYQPQVDARSRALIGIEAFLRWLHPERGMLLPEQFLSGAETSGLIVPIGRWVLRAACAQCRNWHDAGVAPVPVSVNLSLRQFRDPALAEQVKEALHDTGLPPDRLRLCVTETMLVHGGDDAGNVLHTLRRTGAGLSLDGFGSNQTLLGYLRDFAIDRLTLDRRHAHNIVQDTRNGATTRAIIDQAHKLDLTVIAAGVETAEQFDLLRREGCDVLQGYFFSQPQPARNLTDKLVGAGGQLPT